MGSPQRSLSTTVRHSSALHVLVKGAVCCGCDPTLSLPPLTCLAVVPTSVAFNLVSLSLEFFVGTTKGHIIKMDGLGNVLNVLVTPGQSAVLSLSSHPTMAFLFSAHADGHVQTYNVTSGTRLASFVPCLVAACCLLLAAYCWCGLRCLGKHLFGVTAHDSEVTCVASDPTGSMLMSTGACAECKGPGDASQSPGDYCCCVVPGNDCIVKWWSVEHRACVQEAQVWMNPRAVRLLGAECFRGLVLCRSTCPSGMKARCAARSTQPKA